MADDTDGGFTDRQVLTEARGEAAQTAAPSRGWASLGAALGGGLQNNAANAYAQGAHLGAQTIDALAQAKQRVTENEQREQAAQFIEQHGSDLNLSQPVAAYSGIALRAGAPLQDVMQVALQNQQLRARQTIAGTLPGQPQVDPNSTEGIRRAGASLDPSLTAVKPIGTAGSTFDPTANHWAGDSAITPQQYDENQSQIDERNAQAGSAQAAAAEHRAQTAKIQQEMSNPGDLGINAKPPTGYRWKADPNDPTKPLLDDTGRPQAEAIPGMPEKGPGATQGRYDRVLLQSANGSVKDLQNAVEIGLSKNIGPMGAVSGEKGFKGYTKDMLARAASSDDQNMLNTTVSNLARYASYLEQAGHAAPAGMVEAMQTLKPQKGDTDKDTWYKYATVRQILESANETVQSSDAKQGIKDGLQTAVDRAKIAIPFEPADVIKFSRSGNPGESIVDFVNRTHNQGSSGSSSGGGSGGFDMGDAIAKAKAELAKRQQAANPPRAGDNGPPGVQ